MSKSILIIDTPTSCNDCPLCDTSQIVLSDEAYGVCVPQHKELKAEILCTGFFKIKKPKWCPLMSLDRETLYEIIYQAYGLGNDERYKKLRDTIEEVIYGE